ncbi:MAG: hypothetical protein Q9195_008649 [Heterodermia aff. obscurata]
MDTQKFFAAFKEVLAPDTERVKAATDNLRVNFFPLPESLVVLIQLLVSDQAPALRQLAATQATRYVPKHWKVLPDNQKPQLRQKLLERTLYEQEKLVRHGASRVIAAIAKIDFENSEWLELFDILLRAGTDSNALPRQVATYILYSVVDSAGETTLHKFSQILEVCSKTINDPESAEVRINTMLTLSRIAIILDIEHDEESLKGIQDAIPHMVGVLKQAVDAKDEEHTTQTFEVFQTLLTCDSAVLNKHFGDLVQFMIRLAASTDVAEDARTQALNFLMQCVRFRKLKMQGLRVGEAMTKMCLQIATELGDSDDDDDEITTPRSALGLLDVLAGHLPPSQVVVPLLKSLNPYITSNDPDKRQAGILSLGMCVEGAPDFMATQFDAIFPIVISLLMDNEEKVRRNTLDCVIRLGEDLAEELAKQHKKLMPALVKIMSVAISTAKGPDDEKSLSTIQACCNAIDSLFEGMEETDVAEYLPGLYPRLKRLFSHPDLKTKAAAIGAVGTMAQCSKEAFLPYLEQTMNDLQEYVQIKDSPDELDLRCRTCDSMGQIALAVGAKPFQRYVQPLMSATEEAMHLDHPKLKETSFLFWGNMAKVYGTEFKPFLEGIMKCLFESIESEESELEVDLGQHASDLAGKEVTIGGKKVKIAAMSEEEILEASEMEDLEADMDEDEWDSDDDFTALNAVAEEKEIAVEIIGDIMTHATRDCVPYMEKTIAVLLPLISHDYEGVRRATISTLFRAYAAVWELQPEEQRKWKAGLPLQVQPTNELCKLGELIMTATLALWPEEEDRNVVTDLHRSLSAVLKSTGPSILATDTSTIKPLTETLTQVLQKKHPCQEDFMSAESASDASDLNLEESAEYDWLVIDTALDCIIALATSLGPSFAQLYKIFEKPILKFASSTLSTERSTSVGVLAELIRSMGPAVTPSSDRLYKILLHRLSDEDPEAKSNAAFATGLLLEKTEDAKLLTQATFAEVLRKLEPLLQTEEKRCRDNAAGCVCRLIMRNQAFVPLEAVIPVLVDLLPLKEDWEENEAVWACLVGLCAFSPSPFPLPPANSTNNPPLVALTPQLLPILESVLAPPEEQIKESTREKLGQMVRFIAGKHPQEVGKYAGLVEVVRA